MTYLLGLYTRKAMHHPLTEQVKAVCANLPNHFIQNLFLTLQCICLSRTVNLARAKDFVAQVIGTSRAQATQPQSNYRRLIRFFNMATTDYHVETLEALHQITVGLIGTFPARSVRRARQLIVDGTKWLTREQKVQMLTLCVVIDGVAVPIAREELGKFGHSSQAERIDFIDQASAHFDLRGMTLIGDREYIGTEWFKALKTERDIDFVVRIKKDIYQHHIAARGRSRQAMENKLRRCQKVDQVSKLICIEGQEYRYIILRNPKAGRPEEDEFIYLLTSLKSARSAADQYRVRWQIEVTFRHLKSNGFDLESMRLEGPAKQDLLMNMVCVAYVMMVARGIKFYRDNPAARQTKTDHRRQVQTLVHSVFRQGMSCLLSLLAKPRGMLHYIDRMIRRTKPVIWAHV